MTLRDLSPGDCFSFSGRSAVYTVAYRDKFGVAYRARNGRVYYAVLGKLAARVNRK